MIDELKNKIAECFERGKPEKTVSFSQYSTWAKCPQLWYYKYVLEMKSGPSISLMFGTSFHEAIQTWLSHKYNKEAGFESFELFLLERMYHNYTRDLNYHAIEYTSLEEIELFHKQGVELLEMVERNPRQYFDRYAKLVGIEIPVAIKLVEDYDIYYYGLMDGTFFNPNNKVLTIDDYKTSAKGWNSFYKKDVDKLMQLELYRIAANKLFDIPIDMIDTRYLIFSREPSKTYWNPNPKKIEEFIPQTNETTRAVALERYSTMVKSCFDKNGDKLQIKQATNPTKFNCTYCDFKYLCEDKHPEAV